MNRLFIKKHLVVSNIEDSTNILALLIFLLILVNNEVETC